MRLTRVFWLWLTGGVLLGVVVLGVLFIQFGHRWWPNVVVAWSPFPDQVMRAILYRSASNPAGFNEESLNALTQRLSAQQLAEGIGVNVARTERSQAFLAARINTGDQQAIALIDAQLTCGKFEEITPIFKYLDTSDSIWREWGLEMASNDDVRIRYVAYVFLWNGFQIGRDRSFLEAENRVLIMQASRDALANHLVALKGLRFQEPAEGAPSDPIAARAQFLVSDRADRWRDATAEEKQEYAASIQKWAWVVWLSVQPDIAARELEPYWPVFSPETQGRILHVLGQTDIQLPTWLRQTIMESKNLDESYLSRLIRRACGSTDKHGNRGAPDLRAWELLVDHAIDADTTVRIVKRIRMESSREPPDFQAIAAQIPADQRAAMIALIPTEVDAATSE